jgi:hypothetical protein
VHALNSSQPMRHPMAEIIYATNHLRDDRVTREGVRFIDIPQWGTGSRGYRRTYYGNESISEKA